MEPFKYSYEAKWDKSYARTMPEQKPGRSKQDYGTPPQFIDAVKERFGNLDWDLACSKDNCKADRALTELENSLGTDWHMLSPGGNLWLNPPFENIRVWAEKCYTESLKGARIILLTPASIGSNWFANHVHDQAFIYALQGRLTFEGCTQPYPKDCMLSVYDRSEPAGFGVWNWRKP